MTENVKHVRYEKPRKVCGHTMTEKQYGAIVRWMNTHVVTGETIDIERYPPFEKLTPWMDGEVVESE